MHMNYMGMIQTPNKAGFFQELLAESFNSSSVSLYPKGYMTGAAITIAEILHEELLDSHFPLQSTLHCQIGYTETSATEDIDDTICAIVQKSAGLKMLRHFDWFRMNE